MATFNYDTSSSFEQKPTISKIFRFRFRKGWYGYYQLADAEIARQYFLDRYDAGLVGAIEESQDDLDFQFGV